jgi:Cache domain
MVLHPTKPDLEGKDLSSLKDPSGNYIFKSFLSAAKDGKGYSTYYWPKPGLSYPVEKIAYSKLYQPWSWIIGTSTYTKQSENIIGQEQFIIAVSLIELYKIQVGYYPNNLSELERFGSWVIGRTGSVRYEKVSSGYNLFFDVQEKYLNITLPSELKQGLSIVNTNVKFSPKGSVKTIR